MSDAASEAAMTIGEILTNRPSCPWAGNEPAIDAMRRKRLMSARRRVAGDVAFWLIVGMMVLFGACLFGGCASSGGGSGGGVYTPPETPLPPLPDCERRALVVGLSRVQAGAYGAWSGGCGRCVQDAQGFANLTESVSIPTITLLNEAATAENWDREAGDLADQLHVGDLLVLYFSCHGGQATDSSGDEADGMDEYLALWDGPLLDDRIGAFL